MQKKEYSLEVGGRTLTAIFTDLADQAHGSVIIKYGETVVLATAVMSKNQREEIDYLPLTVEYEEKFYAAGRILGGRYVKREGRPSEEAVLSGRIVDRTIRPLFDQRLRHEVQVIITILSIDNCNDPDVISVIAASLALSTSDIPWGGPTSAIRLGDGSTSSPQALKINPTYTEREQGGFDLLVCGGNGLVSMIESAAKEVGEETVAKALEQAVSEIGKIEVWQKEIIKDLSQPKRKIDLPQAPAEMVEVFQAEILPKMDALIFSGPGAQKIYDFRDEVWLPLYTEKWPEENKSVALAYFEDIVDKLLHQEVLERGRRPDGRKFDELRPLEAEAGGISSIVHGVGVFYRGGTHILTVLTLSGPRDSQLVEGMEVQTKKHFMHHYNFPPFSTGETGRIGSPSRRSIGHGALAEKSLQAVLPDREQFPYTIRLVSEALASNGSTSMGSVCASSLALMDGGVPIKTPVAGISVGLMSDKTGHYKILTDIQGPEDHYGDMDFKIAGTKNGITGIQLDIKLDGIPVKILAEAMAQSKKARLQILDKINAVLPAPRPTVKESAPAIVVFKISPEKIGAVIGPGGKTIQKISADFMVEIEIEDDGSVFISGKGDGVGKAKNLIEAMTHEYKPGERYEGTVTRLMEFGAFVKISPNDEGMVHISEIAPFRVERIASFLAVGERVPVVVKEIDEKGRINLSIRQADPDWAKRKQQSGQSATPMQK